MIRKPSLLSLLAFVLVVPGACAQWCKPGTSVFPTGRCFSASASFAPAASATDVAMIASESVSTLLVTGVHISCTQTTAGIVTVSLVKRTSSDSGGTANLVSPTVRLDSSSTGPGAEMYYFTANPSGLGSSLGALRVIQLNCPAGTTAGVAQSTYDLDWWNNPLVLHGPQTLWVNLGGTTVTGGQLAVGFDWIETP